jgi:hypothetical protein
MFRLVGFCNVIGTQKLKLKRVEDKALNEVKALAVKQKHTEAKNICKHIIMFRRQVIMNF